jgi:hypothetical protein
MTSGAAPRPINLAQLIINWMMGSSDFKDHFFIQNDRFTETVELMTMNGPVSYNMPHSWGPPAIYCRCYDSPIVNIHPDHAYLIGSGEVLQAAVPDFFERLKTHLTEETAHRKDLEGW